jgi:DNA-binding NarL/FixJ family response regulator
VQALIVDDHPMTRTGLSLILQALEPGVNVIEAGTCGAAIEAASAPFDLVLLDMGLPDAAAPRVDEIDALKRVKAVFDATPVVIVSGEDDPRLIRAAIDQRASGYLPKTVDSGLIVAALRVVLAHGIYLPPSALLDRDSEPGHRVPRTVAKIRECFTLRQREVLEMALQGKSNKVTGRALGIAEGTVKTHLSRIYAELGVSNRTEALYLLARSHGPAGECSERRPA